MKNPALARRVMVVHLTGQKYEAIVDPCMTGRQLFDAVVTLCWIIVRKIPRSILWEWTLGLRGHTTSPEN